MGDVTIKIDGVSALIAALEAKKTAIDRATYAATGESGRLLQSDARRNFQGSHAPGFHHIGGDKPNTVTGDLQASIRFLTPTVKEGPGVYSNRSGPSAVYGRIIELGGHITPIAAKYLSWFDAQMGVQRFRKSVDIPPRPYFTPSRMALPPKMEAIFYRQWSGAWS